MSERKWEERVNDALKLGAKNGSTVWEFGPTVEALAAALQAAYDEGIASVKAACAADEHSWGDEVQRCSSCGTIRIGP